MTAEPFSIDTIARWSDMDGNAHMANSAYLDVVVEARLAFFEAHGFPVSEFARLKLGPIVVEDTIQYFAEVRLRERLRVTLALLGTTQDGSRFRLRNEIFRGDGRIAARVTSHGAWFDLDRRKIIVPPQALRDAMDQLHRSAEFAEM
jgi:acyl-CoA thioester hydrolase